MTDSVPLKPNSIVPTDTNAEAGISRSDLRQIDEIRSLLLNNEIQALRELQNHLAVLTKRVGDPKALTTSVNEILVNALLETNASDPKGLSQAISPTVLSSIQYHMKHSVDDVVEVLYPITGRMVAASVRDSVKKLSENINRQIETKYSPRGLFATIRSRITGKPISDYLIAESLIAEIDRIMIIEKYSGKIIALHNATNQETEAESADNMNLVSGLLASLSNFAEEVFDTETGGLRTLNLDGRQIVLRRSASHLIAIEISGVLNSKEELLVDEAFLEAIDLIKTQKTESALNCIVKLTKAFERGRDGEAGLLTTLKEKRRGNFAVLKVGGICIALVMSLWAVVNWDERRRLLRDVDQVRTVVLSDPKLANLPIEVNSISSTGEIRVIGLFPTGYDVDGVTSNFKNAAGDRKLTVSYSRIAVSR